MSQRKTGNKISLPDIKPQSSTSALDRNAYGNISQTFDIEAVSQVVGLSTSFIRRVVGRKLLLNVEEVLHLLDLDAFRETIVPRSKVIDYLAGQSIQNKATTELPSSGFSLRKGNALDLIKGLPSGSIACVVTSTPYWALRVYKEPYFANWADGEVCPYGHEQTPEGFVRHTTEILAALYPSLSETGSIWWNVMDSFNTRTQIRTSAVEALRAMQGKDKRKWSEHDLRRYSAGHSYLKDGEQCLIPSMIAERASRLGYFVKSVITWAKTSSLPEPQESRVSRNLEYVIHLSKVRAPKFDKSAYRELPPSLGGRNLAWETDKLSDVWTLPTSSGRDGHGAQFPMALPARCIALSTAKHDVVLDPFVGAGTSGIAAVALGRRFVGFDVADEYLATANRRIEHSRTAPLEDQITEAEGYPSSS